MSSIWRTLVGLSSISESSHSDQNIQKDRILAVWRNLMRTYSTCNLSRLSDKLAAIFGLASSIHMAVNCYYFAGIFDEGYLLQHCGTPYCVRLGATRRDKLNTKMNIWNPIQRLLLFLHATQQFCISSLASRLAITVSECPDSPVKSSA